MYRRIVVSSLAAGVLFACGDNRSPSPASPDAGMEPDGGPEEIPIERAHAGGIPNAVAVVGTRALIAVGPRLTIWDLAASPPALLGESAPLRGVINAVAVAGDRAYVAERIDLDSMIHVFDVSSPAAPSETHMFSVAGSAGYSVVRALEATPTHLYAADQEQGVVVLDLTDPDAPAPVQTLEIGSVTGLSLVGSRLYYTMQGFLGASAGALDLADDLADLGSAPVGNLVGIGFIGNNLVGAGQDGIYVFDVTDPTNPVERFHHGEMEMGPFARAIAVHGTTAWIPADDGLHTLDLSSASTVEHSGPAAVKTTNVNAAGASEDVVAIVTDRGRLLALDRATPTAEPQEVDVSLCADCVGLAVVDATVYVADIVGGLRTATLANLAGVGRSAPLPVVPETGGLEFVFEDVEVAGAHAYVADWLYGLRIYDISDPAAPALVGSLQTGGAPSGVAVVGDRAYIAEGTNGGMLRIIDVSNRAAPVQLGAVETSKAMEVVVRDKYAYVADESLFGSGGLRIFDVTNPAAITQVGLYDADCQFASDVALEGDIAVVACGGNGFHFVDVANPAAPSRVAVVEPTAETGSAWSVATWQGRAVLGHSAGIQVTTLGAQPQVLAERATAWPVRAVTVPSPGRIVAACGPGGAYQWKL